MTSEVILSVANFGFSKGLWHEDSQVEAMHSEEFGIADELWCIECIKKIKASRNKDFKDSELLSVTLTKI